MIKISVIIPVYNSSEYIREAIDSVLKQTFKDLEIIIVDDGSIDDTKKTLTSYIEKYPDKIRYFYQQNKGPAAARNKGTAEAKGEYVAFLDADDIWDADKLEEQIQYFSENPAFGLVYTDYREEDEHCYIREKNRMSKSSCYSFSDILNGKDIATPAVMVRRDILLSMGGYNVNLKTGEDFDLYLRIVKKNPIGFLNKKLVTIRRQKNSLSKKRNTKSGIIEAINSFCMLYPELKNEKSIKIALFFHNVRKGRELFNWGMRRDAMAHFTDAISICPFNPKAYLCFFLLLCPESIVQITRKTKSFLTRKHERIILK